MRTGKPIPYIIKAKWPVRTVCSQRHAVVGMAHASMAQADVNSFLSSPDFNWFATESARQQPENLERKFVGPFMEALKESWSDAWDAGNGLWLVPTEQFPNGKAESQLSAKQFSSLSHCSQSDPPGSHRSLCMLHLNSLLVSAPPPPLPFLSPSHNTYLSVFFPLHLFFCILWNAWSFRWKLQKPFVTRSDECKSVCAEWFSYLKSNCNGYAVFFVGWSLKHFWKFAYNVYPERWPRCCKQHCGTFQRKLFASLPQPQEFDNCMEMRICLWDTTC